MIILVSQSYFYYSIYFAFLSEVHGDYAYINESVVMVRVRNGYTNVFIVDVVGSGRVDGCY